MMTDAFELTDLDKAILNQYQRSIPLTERPFKALAEAQAVAESDIVERIKYLLDQGILSRFGPMYQAEVLGGGLSLAAMSVPEEDYDTVVEQVNRFDEVAHNYERDHALNMWFVLATEHQQEVDQVVKKIEAVTGYKVYNMPKQKEFFVGLHLSV